MTEPTFRDFYRMVKTDPPTLDNFLSGRARGRPIPADPELAAVWDGISVQSTLSQARRKSRISPALGRYVGVLRVPIGGSVRFARTPRAEGHHTLWGDPADVLALVVAVVPA